MTKWEYITVNWYDSNHETRTRNQLMNELGAEGWELIEYGKHFGIYKRPETTNNPYSVE